MAGKWDSFRGSVGRLHRDFGFPTCTFLNFTQSGIDRGQPEGDYTEIGSLDCEFVPPGADSTVDTEGTHLDFTTSIRVPEDDLGELSEAIVQYGEDGERPTRVEAEGTTYEVQSVVPEHGSDMRLLRLTEV